MLHHLVLVRHAEAGPAAVDADRQLTVHGERDAVALGRWLAGTGTTPDRVVVSPARRARQTWELVAAALDAAPAPVLDQRVHDNTSDALLDAVRATEEAVGTLVVVGHNPSLGWLAAVLDPGRPEVLRTGFPPGSAAVLDVDVPFAGVDPGVAVLTDLRSPGS